MDGGIVYKQILISTNIYKWERPKNRSDWERGGQYWTGVSSKKKGTRNI
jgi:hypothetical protein